MLTILETEEFYTNKCLKWRSESLQCQIGDINTVLKSSQSLLQEENDIVFLQVHITVYRLGFIFSYTAAEKNKRPFQMFISKAFLDVLVITVQSLFNFISIKPVLKIEVTT